MLKNYFATDAEKVKAMSVYQSLKNGIQKLHLAALPFIINPVENVVLLAGRDDSSKVSSLVACSKCMEMQIG